MKKNKVIKISLIILSFTITLLANEKIFFMPYDKDKALSNLTKSIELAKNSIDIAIYSFTHKKISKKLKDASKRGVKIRIIFDEELNNEQNKYSKLPNLAKIKNINCKLIKGKYQKNRDYFGKMHNKFAIIDEKKVIFGSANFSNSAFSLNYEILYIKDDLTLAKKFKTYFDTIYSKATFY